MKKTFVIILTIMGCVLTGFAQQPKKNQPEWQDVSKTINATGQEKMSMVYVYNKPCDLCTTMDETIFSDSTVVNTLNKNFIVAKFDSGTKEEMTYNGAKYSYSAFSDTEGVNILAIVLLDGKMGYPTCVFLDKEGKKVGTYFPPKDKQEFLLVLQYYSSGDYLKTPYDEWIKKQ